MQRLIRHQLLTDQALARQPLSRRVTETTRLAQFVGLAPERSDARRRGTFRPRVTGDPLPAREAGPFDRDPASAGEAATLAAWDEPPMVTMPTVDDQPWEPVSDPSPVASDMGPVADDLPVLSTRPYAVSADAAPLADVTPAPPPMPGSAPQDVALDRPQRTVLAPRERMGRRITEEIAQPVRPHVQPIPPVSTIPAMPLPPAAHTPATTPNAEPILNVASAIANADDASPHEDAIGPGEHAVADADRPLTASAASLPIVEPALAPLVESTPRESFPVEEVHTRSLREARAEMIEAALPAPMPPAERAADVPTQVADVAISPPTPDADAPDVAPSATTAEMRDRLVRPDSPHVEPAPAPRVTDDVSPAQLTPSQDLPAVPVTPLPPPLDRPGVIRDGAPPVTPDASGLSAPPPDPPMTATPPREIRAEDLFLPDGNDRSPATWLARLTRAAQPPVEPVAAPEPTAQQPVARPERIGIDAPLTAPQPIPPPARGTTNRRMPGPQRRFVAPVPYSRPATIPPSRPFGSATAGREFVAGAAEEQPAAISERPETQLPQTAVAMGRDAGTPQVGTPSTEERRDDAPAMPAPRLPGRAEQGQGDGAGRSPNSSAERLAQADAATPPPSLAGSPPHAAQGASPLPPTARPAQTEPVVGHPDMPIIEPPPTMPVHADAPAAENTAPTPLSETMRRFLHPLVGIDPGVAPVHRGAHAAGVAASYRADALTDGNVMLLAAGNDSDAPETLGLLAHELTHVARRRDARFVPPIARADDRGDQPPGGIATETSPAALLADEETLARRVETRVVRAARADQRSQMPQPAVSDDRSGPSEPIHARGVSPRAEPMRERERLNSEDWNGLPAPWEPLPDWAMAPAVAPVAPTFGVVAPGAAAPFAPVAPMPQLAEEGHASEGGSPATAPASAPHDPNAPVEPDLDALARQVYGILKRRLALERRNAG